MNKKIKIIITSFIVFCSFVGMVGATPVSALSPVSPIVAASALQGDACAGLSQVNASQGCGSDSGGSITTAVKTAVNILSFVVGIAAVIAIIINGLRFITAQGDASSVASARMGIIYSLAGLVVAALAQLIVHYVLGNV